jgi:hypothetical protein
LIDFIRLHLELLMTILVVCSSCGFVLRRLFGEQRSEKFAAFEQQNPRAAAAITLLDGGFVAVGMLVGAAIQLATGKPPPVFTVTIDEPTKGGDQ